MFKVPLDFFSPILTGAGRVQTTDPFWRLLHNCDFTGLVSRGIEAARARGELNVHASMIDPGNTSIMLLGRLLNDGPSALSSNDLALAVEPIAGHCKEISQNYLLKAVNRSDGEIDVKAFRSSMGLARRKIQDFLNEPSLNMKPSRWPRSTNFIDYTSTEQGTPRLLMLQMDGWSVRALENVDFAGWTPFDVALEDPAAPSI